MDLYILCSSLPFHFLPALSPVAVLLKDDYFVRGAGLPGRFKAEKMEFHWGQSNGSAGSEHSINGRRFPVEVKYPVPTVPFDKCSVWGHEGQAQHKSNVFPWMAFRFCPSTGLKRKKQEAANMPTNSGNTFVAGCAKALQREDVSHITGDKTTHLCLRMCSSSRQTLNCIQMRLTSKGRRSHAPAPIDQP